MKFIYTKGDIAFFDGYTFMFKKPTEVTGCTVDKLLSNPDYRRVDDEPVPEAPVRHAQRADAQDAARQEKVTLRRTLTLPGKRK